MLLQVYAKKGPVRLQKWGYKDCSGGNSPMKINSLDITPDPVEVPGPLNVAASVDVKSDVVSPLTVILALALNKSPKKLSASSENLK